MSSYKPGVCNIGSEEKTKRVRAGVVFAGVSLVLFALIDRQTYGAYLFIPLFISALGFVQARQNFCVAYGLAGKYSMNEFGNAKQVTNSDARNKDVNHSLVLIFLSVVIAAGLTLAAMAF